MITLARAATAVAGVLVLAGCSAGTGARRAHQAVGESPRRVVTSGAAPAAADPSVAVPRTATPSATPSSTAPAGPCTTAKARRAVIVEIHAQHLWMCERHRTVRDTPITSGAVDLPYDATPTGTFHVQSRNRHTTLTLASGAQYEVQYWIPFDTPLFGFHDSPWQHLPYGSERYRTKGSHGCVHMPLAAIRYLYGWAKVGTTVRIRH